MGKFDLFGLFFCILQVFEDSLVVTESVSFVEAFDKVSIFVQLIEGLIASPGLFFNGIHELLRCKYLLYHIFLNSFCKINFKVVFGWEFIVKGFSFDLSDEAFEYEFLLFALIFDFLEYEEFVSWFGEDLKEYVLVKLKVI